MTPLRHASIARRGALCAAVALLAAFVAGAGPARADDLAVEVPLAVPRMRTLEEPPRYGVYYDRYEPWFYTGFAPRALDPSRLHLHVGRGNQLRVTLVLSDAVLLGYARDLDARLATYRRLIAAGRLVPSQNRGFAEMETTLAEVGLERLVAEEKGLAPDTIRARNLALLRRLNPGRVFAIDLSQDELVAGWLAGLTPEDRAGMDRRRALDVVNAMLPTRLWAAELDAAAKRELRALVKRAPAPGSVTPEFRDAFFALLERVSGGRYPRTGSRVRFVEFTSVYPIGTFNETTAYRGHEIPLYPTPGRRALTTHQRTHTVDHIPTKAIYSYSPWIPYMHVGTTLHNAFHTLWWRMDPDETAFLPPAWREGDPRRSDGGPSRYLWLLSRGPMSSGCTHVNTGHIAELRQLLPAETERLYEIDVFLNKSYDYDVFDIDGDGAPEVMGVAYFVAYSLRNKQPHRLRARNERRAFYGWLYGDEIRYRSDGTGWFPEVRDGRFVERTAVRGRTYRDLVLYEAAYEPERIQFYRLVDIDFARRLRQVSDARPFDETAGGGD